MEFDIQRDDGGASMDSGNAGALVDSSSSTDKDLVAGDNEPASKVAPVSKAAAAQADEASSGEIGAAADDDALTTVPDNTMRAFLLAISTSAAIKHMRCLLLDSPPANTVPCRIDIIRSSRHRARISRSSEKIARCLADRDKVRPWLDATVMPALREGLRKLARAHPDDPLQYLADYLLSCRPPPGA